MFVLLHDSAGVLSMPIGSRATPEMKNYTLKILSLQYTLPFPTQTLWYRWILCFVQPRRNKGDHVYSWGKWGDQINMHAESILPEKPRHYTKKLTEVEKLELHQCVAKCCSLYNTLKNFGLHSISDPSLVLHIVFANTKTHFMYFLEVFFSPLQVW